MRIKNIDGLVFERWGVSWGPYGVKISSFWGWGYDEDWYDGPIYIFSVGCIHFSYVP